MRLVRSTALAGLLVLAAGSASADSLVESAKAADVAAVSEMIAAGENVNAPSSDGTTALHWAAYNDDLMLVEQLLEAGANPDVRNDYGSSPMLEAALNGNAEIIARLLVAGADPDSPDDDGQTALMIAARTASVDAARLLVEHGADVNAVEQWRGQTALMWAAAQSQPDMVALLVEHGADPNARSTVNDWARQVSAEARRHYRPTGGLTPLLFAAREGCLGCAQALVEGGADLELADPDNITPLFLAIDNLHFDTAKFLLAAGANPNRWDRWGRTPLYGAVDMNTVPAGGFPDRPSIDETTSLEMVELLLEAGANPDAQLKNSLPHRSIVDDRGCDRILHQPGPTPLLRAAKAFDVPAMELLLEHGARVDLPNDWGITPLMAAAGLGSVECDTRGPSERIPQYLDDEVEQWSIAALGILLDAGADINVRSREDRGRDVLRGQTALHGAAFWGWNDVVEFLVEHGARIDVADANGMTPVDAALGRAGGNARGSRIDIFEDTADLLVDLCAQRADCNLPSSNADTDAAF
jgi:ankyrin repeat protein